MGFLEILTPPPESRERVKVPTGLVLDIMSSFQQSGEGKSYVSTSAVKQLYAAIFVALGAEPPRMVVYDHSVVLVDGRTVDGLTQLHKDVLEYISSSDRPVSLDTLATDVWHNADVNPKVMQNTVYRINKILAPYQCYIELKSRCYQLKFHSLIENSSR